MFSQSKFIPGFILKNHNDTIKGYISTKSLNPYHQICQFKPFDSSITQVLKPNEISLFGTNDLLVISASEIDRRSGQVKPKEFFKLIFDGQLDILLGSQKRYFIRPDTAEFLYHLNNKDFLFYLTSNSPGLSKEITQASLSENSLVDIMKKYHDNTGYDNYNIYMPDETIKTLDFFVTGSYTASVLSLFNNTGNRVFNVSNSPSIGWGIDYFPAIRSKQELFALNAQIRFNCNLFQNQIFKETSTSFFYEDILFKSYSLKIPFGIKLRNSRKENTSLFINPGLFLQIDFPREGRKITGSKVNNQVIYRSEKIEYFRSTTFGFYVAGGAEKKLKNGRKIFAEISYELSGDNNFIMNAYSINLGTRLLSRSKK